jgi:hypothetical protein
MEGKQIMNRSRVFSLVVAANIILVIAMVGAVLAEAESEPNDTPAQANPLITTEIKTGAIDPAGDLDYFQFTGVNPTWGFIALLDTVSSTASTDGVLTGYGPDGSTPLQSDSGSWERGSGIALQAFSGHDQPHYLRVEESGGDETISTYNLRYFETIIATQPEIEPNETPSTGTPSSFTHEGVIDSSGDVDCYAFQGRADDHVIVALDGDPEGDGSPADLALKLFDPSSSELKSVDVTGAGGKEFIEYDGLASDGVYAYCLNAVSGTGGANATYKVGLVRNGFLYFPDYRLGATWENKPSPGFAQVGDTLNFRLAITNTSPLTIPGDITMYAYYSEDCLSFVDALPAPTTTYTGTVSWSGQKSGLAPGEAYALSLDMKAEATCIDTLHQSTVISYYFTGTGRDAKYSIPLLTYLPLLQH